MAATLDNIFGPVSNLINQTPLSGTQVSGIPATIQSVLSQNNSTSAGNTDLRVRLNALNPAIYSSSPVMSVLSSTGGMMFPYTPSITVTQAVDYASVTLVHSNTDYQAYTRSPSVKISVNGKFTVQNYQEGLYALAAIHFLRTVSKSYFGETDAQGANAGQPPPVLVFTGYGSYMFNNLRVVLASHTFNFEENVDTVAVNVPVANQGQAALSFLSNPLGSIISQVEQASQINGGVVRIPAMFTIGCELLVIQTPSRMRKLFSFDAFANGTLMSGPYGTPGEKNGWI
jgi:hypothetical protein